MYYLSQNYTSVFCEFLTKNTLQKIKIYTSQKISKNYFIQRFSQVTQRSFLLYSKNTSMRPRRIPAQPT